MQLKKDKPKIIIVDASTYRNGFALDLEELLDLIGDSSGNFYHPADESLLRGNSLSPGRTNQVNLTGKTQWITKNAQHQNLYLEFRSLLKKKPNHSKKK